MITQDASNKALENHSIKGSMIKDPITRSTRSKNGIVFADDLTQIAMFNVSLCTPVTKISGLTHITQLANNNLRASGVFLHPKMQLSRSVINKNGVLHNVILSKFNIQPTPTTEHQQLHQMMRSDPHCMLGVHLTPDKRPTAQYIQINVNMLTTLII